MGVYGLPHSLRASSSHRLPPQAVGVLGLCFGNDMIDPGGLVGGWYVCAVKRRVMVLVLRNMQEEVERQLDVPV